MSHPLKGSLCFVMGLSPEHLFAQLGVLYSKVTECSIYIKEIELEVIHSFLFSKPIISITDSIELSFSIWTYYPDIHKVKIEDKLDKNIEIITNPDNLLTIIACKYPSHDGKYFSDLLFDITCRIRDHYYGHYINETLLTKYFIEHDFTAKQLILQMKVKMIEYLLTFINGLSLIDVEVYLRGEQPDREDFLPEMYISQTISSNEDSENTQEGFDPDSENNIENAENEIDIIVLSSAE
jgi:hypothetical protein